MRLNSEAYPELDRLLRASREGAGPFADTAAADGKWSPLEQEVQRLVRLTQDSALDAFLRTDRWNRLRIASADFSQRGLRLVLDYADGVSQHCVTIPWSRVWRDILLFRDSVSRERMLIRWMSTRLFLRRLVRDPGLEVEAEAQARAWARGVNDSQEAHGGIFGNLDEAEALLDSAAFPRSPGAVAWKGETPPSTLLYGIAYCRCFLSAALRRILTQEAP